MQAEAAPPGADGMGLKLFEAFAECPMAVSWAGVGAGERPDFVRRRVAQAPGEVDDDGGVGDGGGVGLGAEK